MKRNLNDILADSLSSLKDLSLEPSMESLEEELPLFDSAQMTDDLQVSLSNIEHMDNDSLRDMIQEHLQANEQEHRQMRSDIKEVQYKVQSVIGSMEMLSVLSMESLDEHGAAAANMALAKLASDAHVEAPMVETEYGQITQASMEGVIDFVKTTLASLKNWIKEKMQNIAMSFRRSAGTLAALRKRIDAAYKRLDSLPSDYGIPAKPMRYDPAYIGMLYRNGEFIGYGDRELKAAFDEGAAIVKHANDVVVPDAIVRSTILVDNLTNVLVATDGVKASKDIKDTFIKVSGPWKAGEALQYGKEVTGGVTYVDESSSYRPRYRDAAYITDLIAILEVSQTTYKERSNGRIDTGANDLTELRSMLDSASAMLENPVVTENNWYYDLGSAWRDAAQMYNRLAALAASMALPHMDNELWRSIDVGVTAMFLFLDKAYAQNLRMRQPMERTVHGMLYLVEEQLKAYAAVNR